MGAVGAGVCVKGSEVAQSAVLGSMAGQGIPFSHRWGFTDSKTMCRIQVEQGYVQSKRCPKLILTAIVQTQAIGEQDEQKTWGQGTVFLSPRLGKHRSGQLLFEGPFLGDRGFTLATGDLIQVVTADAHRSLAMHWIPFLELDSY